MVVVLENSFNLCRVPKGIISLNVHLLQKCQGVGWQLEAVAHYDSLPAQLLSDWRIGGDLQPLILPRRAYGAVWMSGGGMLLLSFYCQMEWKHLLIMFMPVHPQLGTQGEQQPLYLCWWLHFSEAWSGQGMSQERTDLSLVHPWHDVPSAIITSSGQERPSLSLKIKQNFWNVAYQVLT